MTRTISTPDAPAAIGPYSQAITAGGWLFGSGQIALDPAGGQIVGPDDIAAQTEQIFANITAVLAAAGAGLAQIVKTTVYLKDLGQFGEMNTVYEQCMGAHKPARATVEVARLPKDLLVEIDFIAHLGSG